MGLAVRARVNPNPNLGRIGCCERRACRTEAALLRSADPFAPAGSVAATGAATESANTAATPAACPPARSTSRKSRSICAGEGWLEGWRWVRWWWWWRGGARGAVRRSRYTCCHTSDGSLMPTNGRRGVPWFVDLRPVAPLRKRGVSTAYRPRRDLTHMYMYVTAVKGDGP